MMKNLLLLLNAPTCPHLPGLSKLLTLPFCACRLCRLPVMCIVTQWFPPLKASRASLSELLGVLILADELIKQSAALVLHSEADLVADPAI